MLTTVILLILILILIIVGRKIKKQPPGPFPWPIIGNHFVLKRLTREMGYQHLAFMELSKRYNSNVITVGSNASKMVIVFGNKCIQSVLYDKEYDGRPWNEFIKMRNLGKKQGITMNDGEDWKQLRGWMIRTMRYFGFGKREMLNMIENELNIILKKLSEGGVQKMKPLIGSAVINVVWMMATGTPFHDVQKLKYFTDLLDRRSRAFDMVGGLLSAFPWIRYIAPKISGYELLMTLNNELKDFIMGIIVDHKKRYTPENKQDLIDMFLHEMFNDQDSNSVFTDDQLTMMLIDLFLAGCSTTSTTLDFLFLSMVLHQDVQRKVQKEIDSVIPSDRLPDLEDRAKLPYTEAVIQESQRRWPIFPIIGPRRVLHDTNLDGYEIPKESAVLLNIYSVNMDPTIYPEPDKFKPERFLKDGVFEPDVNSLSFGKGRRRCPGEVLAKSAMFLLFTGVMQKYSLLPVPGKELTSVGMIPGIVISPKPYEILVVQR